MAEQFAEPIVQPGPVTELARAHQRWLNSLVVPVEHEGRWATHDQFSAQMAGRWTHYGALDHILNPHGTAIVWRFCSKPTSETISITANTGIGTIIDVIGKHSGGNDKKNQDVRTSSFCRNPGAILGTAASGGGDKNVLRIINNAEYLCGIEIGTLANKGVSAHPALSRMISLFETEYVLVATPGLAAIPLATLATVKYHNPFKGLIQSNGQVGRFGTLALAGSDDWMKPGDEVKVEPLDGAVAMSGDQVQAIVNFAVKSCRAANLQFATVQSKEPEHDIQIVQSGMTKYLNDMDPGETT